MDLVKITKVNCNPEMQPQYYTDLRKEANLTYLQNGRLCLLSRTGPEPPADFFSSLGHIVILWDRYSVHIEHTTILIWNQWIQNVCTFLTFIQNKLDNRVSKSIETTFAYIE